MKNFILKLESKYPRLCEAFRFLFIGGFATLIDMLVMALIIYFPNEKAFEYSFINVFLYKNVASTFWVTFGTASGFIAGLLFNYAFSVIFVYKGENRLAKSAKGFLLFVLFSLIGLFIQTFGVYIGYEFLHINEWILKVIFVLVVLIFNYFTRKKFIFVSEEPNSDRSNGEN